MTKTANLRQNLVARLEVLGHRVDDLESGRREPLEADLAEPTTQIEGAQVASALEQRAILEAQHIKAAIQRIDAGSYGECINCAP
jgi:RNA polymerase-binding transcription factor DksA